MSTLTNSEDLYEMLHNAGFHLCLHCLLRERNIILFENYIPLIFTMDHSKSIVSYQKEKPIYA